MKEGYAVLTAEKGLEGLEVFRDKLPDVTLVDIHLPDVSGMTVLERITEIDPDAVVIMIVSYGNIDTAVKSVSMGAHDFIEKPFNMDKLIIMMRKAVETVTLRREVRDLRERAGHSGGECIISLFGAGDLEINLPSSGVDIEEIDRRLIEKALEMSGGSEDRTAGLLRITRESLRERMRKAGLPEAGR